MISDRRPQFTAELIKELNKMLEIETKLSTFLHPQMNRQTKIYEPRIRKISSVLCGLQTKELARITAELAVNNKTHSVLWCTWTLTFFFFFYVFFWILYLDFYFSFTFTFILTIKRHVTAVT